MWRLGLDATLLKFFFMYLGVPVRGNMNRIVAWKSLIDKFMGRMALWNAKLLSIGGRLTLIKAVMRNLAIYYMSLFKFPNFVLKSLETFQARCCEKKDSLDQLRC